jgi:hypothetical protein
MARSSTAARIDFGFLNTVGILTPAGFQLSATTVVHNSSPSFSFSLSYASRFAHNGKIAKCKMQDFGSLE